MQLTSALFGVFLQLILTNASMARIFTAVNVNVEKPQMNGRIVGGKIVDISLHPHQVSLRIKDILVPGKHYFHTCGGSIITEHIILTAAHCVFDKVASQIQIVVGTNEQSGCDGIIVPVTQIISHEQYDSVTVNNDIALIVVGAALPFNNFTIAPVELTEVEPQHNEVATITGWGLTSSTGYASALLREVKVPIIGNKICREQSRYRKEQITDGMLCAGLMDVGGKDACSMDSGGPLLVRGKLAGVVSWGVDCARPYYPGVYANVWYFLPWIKEKVAMVGEGESY